MRREGTQKARSESKDNLFEVSKRAIGLLVTPIFTLFFMTLFVRFATAAGANCGAVCGFLTAVLIAFWNPLVEDRSLSITWINPVALTVGIVTGCAVSLLTRAGQSAELSTTSERISK